MGYPGVRTQPTRVDGANDSIPTLQLVPFFISRSGGASKDIIGFLTSTKFA
jgi:hypothetical protein